MRQVATHFSKSLHLPSLSTFSLVKNVVFVEDRSKDIYGDKMMLVWWAAVFVGGMWCGSASASTGCVCDPRGLGIYCTIAAGLGNIDVTDNCTQYALTLTWSSPRVLYPKPLRKRLPRVKSVTFVRVHTCPFPSTAELAVYGCVGGNTTSSGTVRPVPSSTRARRGEFFSQPFF